MSDIRTSHWFESVTIPRLEALPQSSHWARVDPPAESWRTDYPAAWSLSVRDSRGLTHTASDWDHCSFSPHPVTAEQILANLAAPALPDGDGALASRWSVTREILYGRTVVLMKREFVSGNYRVVQSVWAEPDTRRLVRCETRSVDIETGETTEVQVRERFEYNVDIPAGAFDMPAGRPIVTHDLDAYFPDVWTTMAPADREEIERAIATCDAAWRSGSFRMFASVWRFGLQRHLPGRARWRQRFQRHAGHWARWETAVEGAREMQGIMAPSAAHSFRGGKHVSDVLSLHGTCRAVWADDGRERNGRVTFDVQRRDDGWRIVQWDAPWYEIEDRHRRPPGAVVSRA